MRNTMKWIGMFTLSILALLTIGSDPSHVVHAAQVARHGVSLDHLLLGPLMGIPVMGVTNTLGNYNETTFAQEALIQLEKVLGMAGRIHRGYSPEPKAQGDTIQIRRPSTFVATDAPAASSNLNTDSIAIVVNKWKEVKFELTDKDLSLTNEKIITDHIRPAAVALADQIDQDLATLYTQIPWVVALQATPTLGDIAKIRKQMFDNKVPLRDAQNLHYMIDGATELAFLTALSASGMMPNQQDTALREGSMGRLFGFDVWANQNTPLHTSGVAADAVGTVDGVNAVGATSVSISAVSAGITVKVGDVVAIAGDPQQYTIGANGTDADGAAFAITLSSGLKKATAGGEVVTITLVGANKFQTIGFHHNFAALATAPLSDMGKELGAKISTISDPITGLSLRSRMFYDGDNSKVKVALDVLYGFKLLDPNLAVRGTQP